MFQKYQRKPNKFEESSSLHFLLWFYSFVFQTKKSVSIPYVIKEGFFNEYSWSGECLEIFELNTSYAMQYAKISIKHCTCSYSGWQNKICETYASFVEKTAMNSNIMER